MAAVDKIFSEALKLHEEGDVHGASTLYQEVLGVDKNNIESLTNLAAIMLGGGNNQEAYEYFKRVYEISPSETACKNLAISMRSVRKFDESVELCQDGIKKWPESEELFLNLVSCLRSAKRFDDAIDLCKQGLQKWPNDPNIATTFACIQIDLQLFSEAIETCDGFINANGGNSNIYNCLANAYSSLKQLDEAEKYYIKALELNSDNQSAHYNYSQLKLKKGNFKEGFATCDYIWNLTPPAAIKRPFPHPWWEGEDLKGKTILLWQEQGIGEAVMFASMIQEIIELADKCIIEVDARLIPIFKRTFPDADIYAQGHNPDQILNRDDIDVQSPFCRLAKFLRKEIADFEKAGSQFLLPSNSKKLANQYKQFDPAYKVGISWFTSNSSTGHSRNISLEQLKPLFSIPNIQFFNLQYGDHSQGLKATPIFSDPQIDIFNDIDGLIEQIDALDLIISIDNSTLHFASSIGKETWGLIPFASDWRWRIDEKDSYWYPSLKLYRQDELNDWTSIIENIAEELRSRSVA